jgi:hypothetical protein
MSILFNGILAGNGGGGGGGGGIPEAPTDGKIYGRQNAGWSAVELAKYRHIQSTPATSWNIQHNLGSKPLALFVFDAAGDQIYGEPDFSASTLNQLSVYFSVPIAGTAFVHTLL